MKIKIMSKKLLHCVISCLLLLLFFSFYLIFLQRAFIFLMIGTSKDQHHLERTDQNYSVSIMSVELVWNLNWLKSLCFFFATNSAKHPLLLN